MNYYQREQQPPLSGVVSSTANTECSAQALCFYDANQQLINVTSSDYLQTDNSLPASSETPATSESLLLHYSIESNICPIYRPLQEGLSRSSDLRVPPPPSSSSTDDMCFIMESSVNECCTTQGLQPQSLNWQAFVVDSWFSMRDPALQDITHDEVTSGFCVEADKGFNYSQWDESFVCQKKNHFQISVQLRFSKIPKFLKFFAGGCEMEVINFFSLHLHGIKFEMPDSVIPIEQSRTDRSKLSYEPIIIDLPNFPDQIVKASACRLHFSETTSNNMRKRGKPNPDQRYFALVVTLHAHTASGHYPVVAYVSERIIVRASNPGQFDNEGDATWLKGTNSDIVFYQGKVGINTEAPEEALSVIGNVQITGQILQPSDARLKTDIKQINTSKMLNNIQKLKLCSYTFKANAFGNENQSGSHRKEIGLIAQEVANILPDAVMKAVSKNYLS
jgi:hypothetical protein